MNANNCFAIISFIILQLCLKVIGLDQFDQSEPLPSESLSKLGSSPYRLLAFFIYCKAPPNKSDKLVSVSNLTSLITFVGGAFLSTFFPPALIALIKSSLEFSELC